MIDEKTVEEVKKFQVLGCFDHTECKMQRSDQESGWQKYSLWGEITDEGHG